MFLATLGSPTQTEALCPGHRVPAQPQRVLPSLHNAKGLQCWRSLRRCSDDNGDGRALAVSDQCGHSHRVADSAFEAPYFCGVRVSWEHLLSRGATLAAAPGQSVGCGSRDPYPGDPQNITGSIEDLQLGHTAHGCRVWGQRQGKGPGATGWLEENGVAVPTWSVQGGLKVSERLVWTGQYRQPLRGRRSVPQSGQGGVARRSLRRDT